MLQACCVQPSLTNRTLLTSVNDLRRPAGHVDRRRDHVYYLQDDPRCLCIGWSCHFAIGELLKRSHAQYALAFSEPKGQRTWASAPSVVTPDAERGRSLRRLRSILA